MHNLVFVKFRDIFLKPKASPNVIQWKLIPVTLNSNCTIANGPYKLEDLECFLPMACRQGISILEAQNYLTNLQFPENIFAKLLIRSFTTNQNCCICVTQAHSVTPSSTRTC